MMGTTSETVDARIEACEDEASAPDALDERVDAAGVLRVTVVLIDNGRFCVDALELF